MSTNASTTDQNSALNYILLFRLIVWGYVGMVLSVFGIVGNVITIVVLTSPSMRTTSTNIYLTALSCSNILFLLIFIPSFSVRYLIGYQAYKTSQPLSAYDILLTRLPTTPIYNTILLSIIYLTIAVSLDRLILVKVPLKAKQILTPRTTVTAIALIYLFSIAYCIPYWLEQEYLPETHECQLTQIGLKIYKYTRVYIYIPVVYLIPFTTLTFINISIILSLVAKKRRKKTLGAKTNKKKQTDYHITLMLVAVIIIFVLCQIPLLVLNVWQAYDASGAVKSLFFRSLNSMGILLMVFNTSTNFLLYCFFGQKFRATLVRFILHLFLNSNKQTNLQTRIARMSGNTARPRLSALLNSSTLATPKNASTKMAEVVRETTVERTTLNESSRLLEQAEPAVPVSEKPSPTDDRKLSLYACANGQRLLVLKI